jgi:PAS domain S-box-containing protein
MSTPLSTWGWVLLCLTGLAWVWWRRDTAKRQSSLAEAQDTAAAAAPWYEVLGRLGPLVAAAPTRAEAVRSLAHVLQTELGAQGVRILDIREMDTDAATVQPWSDDPLLRAPAPFSVPLSQSPLGVAIRRLGVAGDGTSGFALAWPGVALEGASTGLSLAAEFVQQLLDVAHAMVSLGPTAAALPVAGTAPAVKREAEAPVRSYQLIDSLPASMFLFEPTELRLMSINQEAEREFSLDRDEMVGRTLVEAFGVTASQVAEPHMRRALAEHGMVESDYAWTNRLGARVMQVRHRALRDPQGKPLLLMVAARDITSERQTQHELQEAQSRFLEFSEVMEDSLFIANPARTKFYFLAGSTYELWGVTPEHAARGELFANIVEADRPLLEQRMRCEEALEPADFVFRVQHPRKGLTFVRTRSRTCVMPDGSLRVYGVVSDVTKEQAREEQLLAARDAAESASLAKSHFMANMSHEIRTPMNGILGMTELLLNTALDERQRNFAQAVYRSGETLLATLDDILDFAKLDAGHLVLSNADFVLRTVVEDTLELLAPQAHKKRLELNFRERPGTPERVHGDARRLRQILSKFVANGIKFTTAGEVVVDLRLLPSDGPGWRVEFSVSDTGQGMAEDVLPRLFTAFTQAHGGWSRHHEGIGLGLAIAGRLVALMGGQVDVRSTPGSGSVFTFSLPLEEAHAIEPPVEAQHSQSDPDVLVSPRVLLVEDHATSRQVLQQMLIEAGMQVSGVENGQQALNLLRESESSPRPFDVALVDIHMPQLDGISMARVLRQDSRHQHLKLILMSASASADDVRQAQKIGFQGFLSKPVRKAELRQLIANVCGGQKDRQHTTPRLSGRVLVVEDNVVNQEVIGQMLRKLHVEVQMAGAALQGLRALCEQRFDLVLMDIMMPGMDGIEALRWFREGGDARFDFVTPRDTPVVAVTANALEGDEARFLELGFNGYLSKPLRQSQLIHMLSKHLPLNEAPLGVPPTVPAALEAPLPLALDPEALDRLKELDPRGDNQLIQRVIGAFQTSVARLVPQLEEACRAGDLGGVRHVAHTFKSSSASIGALELSQRCTELETLIRQDRVDNLDQRVDDLCKEIALVSKALQTLLDRQT